MALDTKPSQPVLAVGDEDGRIVCFTLSLR